MKNIFKITENNTTIGKEIIGGITSFLAMAYILALNPSILSDAGMNWNAVFTATAISAAFATLIMAFIANLPVALAPGLGLNAFFAYTVVIGMGCSWQLALTAVFIEGIIFILLSLGGIREAIINSIPESLKKAVAVGIGLFVTILGLVNAGILSKETGTFIGYVNFNLANKTAIVALIGLIITIILYILKVPGAVLLGIVITTIIGIPFAVTTVPENFSPIATPSTPHLFEFDFKGIVINQETQAFSWATLGQFLVILITFLFTDLFDTIGTLLGVTEQGNLKDEEGNIKNVRGALLADSIGTVAGACLGTSTVTSFVESSAGVAAGARTGLASVVTAVLFLFALLFNPLFALIPSAATAPALIFVGFLMMKSVTSIKFEDPTEGIPAFLAIITMPFAYSISDGIAWGIISYVICKVTARKIKEIPIVTWILAIIFTGNFIFEAIKG
ncbi:MAG: NCS2 family permease [Treponema sp.]|nr:NCS2 family permease [Treponema sp.]MBQ2234578.1 NCS2 family permease [Treponema sp.]MBQ5647379.1 NCS2 family permease [Treponema sp.]MBQ5878022.1 NCS2 family permease [Treponema sp.]